MLPEQKKQIRKFFLDLARDCDLKLIMRKLEVKEPSTRTIIENINFEETSRHNNRCIIFKLLQTNSPTLFHNLINTLRENNFTELANKLENKPTPSKHMTCCFQLPSELVLPPPGSVVVDSSPLVIDVKYSTAFHDGPDAYRTRSKNRGHVLIINNIHFETDHHRTRQGAEVDEKNLKELFDKMGFTIELHRDLTKKEIENFADKFANKEYQDNPDVCIMIIMSHGERLQNKTLIIGADGNGVEEEWIVQLFNNKTCTLFRNKPKILIFHICRGELVDNLAHFAQHTESDSACTRQPDYDNDGRFYSDMIVCHPSVEGFQAHRDTMRGCWYIELLCQVFMENAHEMDVETMLKMVEKELKNRISEKMTRQTSTFLNIAFRNCYLNPGIYEHDGNMIPLIL